MSKGGSIRGTAVGSAAAYRDLLAIVDERGIKPPTDRAWIAALGALGVVPTRSHEPRREDFDRELHRERNVE